MLLTRYSGFSWLRRVRRRIYSRIPEWVRRNDFQLFAAFLCASAGVPLLVTHHVEASSIDATLPYGLVKAWSAMLVLAPACIAVGLAKAANRPISEVTFWLRLEAYGLRALAYASYVYAVCIVVVNGFTVAPALSIILAFALTCHSRSTAVTIRVEDYLDHLGVGRDAV
jgi:hypothetical protein